MNPALGSNAAPVDWSTLCSDKRNEILSPLLGRGDVGGQVTIWTEKRLTREQLHTIKWPESWLHLGFPLKAYNAASPSQVLIVLVKKLYALH